MLWCFGSIAVLCMLLALLALTVRLPRLSRPHPIRLLRGCTALLCLLIAAGAVLAAVAFVAQW